MDQRRIDLANWARHQLSDLLKNSEFDVVLENLSGDASFRRYFRARLIDASYILVDAPPEKEDCRTFVRVAESFREAGLITPKVHSVDYEMGFMLLEDFGDGLYLQELAGVASDSTVVNDLYDRAIDALITLQGKVDGTAFPPYNRALLHRELALFEEWFCERFLGMTLASDERDIIANCFVILEDAALSQTQVAVHRDYHSRNLMIPDQRRYDKSHIPALIDFQDAVCGPYTYDLVSLLRDCYIRWPSDYVRTLASRYQEKAVAQGLIANVTSAQFVRDFDLMGMQRHLKVIGIFARLGIRDNKEQYLADIPLVIAYFLDVAQLYKELQPFVDWFNRKVMPLATAKLPAGDLCER